MRIAHNISSMMVQGSLHKVNKELNSSLEKLSTGLRINRASDDAAGLCVSEGLRAQIRGNTQAIKNAEDGIAAITIAEGSANEVSEILQRMRELALQSSNDTLSSTERVYTNLEYNQLKSEIDRISEVTNYNGMKLISSSGTLANTRFGMAGAGSTLWIGANHNYSFDGMTITIESTSTNLLGSGAQGGGLPNLGTSAIISQTSSVVAIKNIDESIDSVNRMRSSMGAFTNRLERAINNLTTLIVNLQAAESMIRDVDFAGESAKFVKNQILMQMSTAMLTQANQIPNNILSLLR